MDNIRHIAKIALENMYMLGGMPKPDPNYDKYLNNMIEMIVKEVEKTMNKNMVERIKQTINW